MMSSTSAPRPMPKACWMSLGPLVTRVLSKDQKLLLLRHLMQRLEQDKEKMPHHDSLPVCLSTTCYPVICTKCNIILDSFWEAPPHFLGQESISELVNGFIPTFIQTSTIAVSFSVSIQNFVSNLSSMLYVFALLL